MRSNAVRIALLFAMATAAWTQILKPPVPLTTMKEVETAANSRLRTAPADPWSVLGDARGTYLPGGGTVVTFELALANLTPITPFHPSVSPEERRSAHDRKVKNLAVLKVAMREMIAHAATALTAMPGKEQITFEAFLFNFNWEDRAGLPERLTVCANRQKVTDAIARHASAAEMASLFEESSEQ